MTAGTSPPDLSKSISTLAPFEMPDKNKKPAGLCGCQRAQERFGLAIAIHTRARAACGRDDGYPGCDGRNSWSEKNRGRRASLSTGLRLGAGIGLGSRIHVQGHFQVD